MQILRLKEACKKLKLSRSTLYEKLNEKSRRYDPAFPKPVRLGLSAMGFFESELDKWLEARGENR